MAINYQFLQYFKTAAQTEHFTLAAEELGITQPTLTRAVQSIENELGVPLFEKTGRNVRLTTYGRILRDQTIQSFAGLEQAFLKIQEMGNVITGTIHMGSTLNLNSSFFPKIARQYLEIYPAVKLTLHQMSPPKMLELFTEGKIELAICAHNFEESEEMRFEKQPLYTDEFCLVVPEQHRLASYSSVKFNDFKEEEFIGYGGALGIGTSVRRVFLDAGISWEPRYRILVSEPLPFVREGMGICFASKNHPADRSGLKFIPVDYPFLYRKFYLLWCRDRYISPAANNFRRFILSNI